ncbi:xylulokinase [Sphingomonas sp.]|uniref:xylulokinase n=1 Tax=Sphingomonas sp. TaxID=28214 RepID=UPI000DB3CDDB|nr:xylulokinase [Sphingomonas sp.]PZU08794.1 MAG: xylulokinase [Sphingomonas sp.]
MFLGIDIGTSGVKAVVIDDQGLVAGQGTAGITVSRPHDLWSEQSPDSWWQATEAAVRAIDPALRRSVRAIGLAGQMHGATLLDEQDRPLRPCILWNDGRSFAECAELEERVPALREISGNIAMPGFTAPKLLWVAKHEPEIFARTRTILLPKDFVRLQMTGERATDMSDAAGTIWLDTAARAWSPELLAACGLDTSHMPALYEGNEATGVLRASVAEAWGMGIVPVVGGGGDNAAGAVGVGVVRNGDALLSLGTSGVIFVANDRFSPNPAEAVHAFCHAIPDTWHQMAVHLSAASCIDWVARLTGVSGPAELFARAETVGPGGTDALFLPYLSGERTPHNDSRVRGAFLHLENDTDGPALARAVLEGVAFGLADGLRVLKNAGADVRELAVIGGGARSSYWGRIIAAALETPLVYLSGGEVGPALGAARLAQSHAERVSPAEICVRPHVSSRIEPDPEIAEKLARKRELFGKGYSHIKDF